MRGEPSNETSPTAGRFLFQGLEMLRGPSHPLQRRAFREAALKGSRRELTLGVSFNGEFTPSSTTDGQTGDDTCDGPSVASSEASGRYPRVPRAPGLAPTRPWTLDVTPGPKRTPGTPRALGPPRAPRPYVRVWPRPVHRAGYLRRNLLAATLYFGGQTKDGLGSDRTTLPLPILLPGRNSGPVGQNL